VGILFQSFPQPADMDIKGSGVVQVVGVPDLFHQGLTAYYLPTAAHQDVEQTALERGEVMRALTVLEGPLLEVQSVASHSERCSHGDTIYSPDGPLLKTRTTFSAMYNPLASIWLLFPRFTLHTSVGVSEARDP
jgi:hypothetical protein